jgi:hypothetical protein
MNFNFQQIFEQTATLASALAVLTAMITPALLIMASGTFILSTSNRLGRVIDRMRVVSDKIEQWMQSDVPVSHLEERRTLYLSQLDRLSRRAGILQRSITLFYLAAATFMATSVTIGVIAVAGVRFAGIPVVLGIIGACLLFYGSVLLIFEARLAVASIRAEMELLNKLVEEGLPHVPSITEA